MLATAHCVVHAAQVSDGAGAVLLMTRREARRRQLPVLGVFRSFAAVGVDPAVMGVGPSVRRLWLRLTGNVSNFASIAVAVTLRACERGMQRALRACLGQTIRRHPDAAVQLATANRAALHGAQRSTQVKMQD